MRDIEAAIAAQRASGSKPRKLTADTGLRLHIGATGKAVWCVLYMIDGREREYRLPEPYGTGKGHCSLAAARERASEIRALARGGVDIQKQIEDARAAAERVAQREREAQDARERRLTVRALFERWAALELGNRKDRGAETRRGMEKDVLPAIGERYAEDVRRREVMDILDTVKARGANRLANRLLSEMRQMFGFAFVREIVPSDPTFGIKKRDVGGKETERDRVLSEHEIRLLPGQLAAANLLDSTTLAVWVMLSTSCRIGELTGATKADIDLRTGVWVLPETKNSKSHTIYLSDFAKRHLQALMTLSADPAWLFPSHRTEGAVTPKSITKQLHDRQRGKAKTNGPNLTNALMLPGGNWTPHDLRRTGATLMGELGVRPDVIEKCLNHLDENRMRRVYQRAVKKEEQIEAWRLLGDRLDLLTRMDADNVTILKSA
ncbi:tyrosine-type recombinase/integrase [Pandoraea terrae]|uniref:tyrosine-type recombinase/integrase n=1 Tax=Pandoraea terrae TaxID=1537710 RepID=UPI0021E52261|nr:site-specific integrase [Pandoraea terrae]